VLKFINPLPAPEWLCGKAVRLKNKTLTLLNIGQEFFMRLKRAWGLPKRTMEAAIEQGGELLELRTTTGQVLTIPLKVALADGKPIGYHGPNAPLFIDERFFTQRAGEGRKAA